MLSLVFEFGTLALRGLAQGGASLPPPCQWDARSGCYRAPAIAYADVVRALVRQGVAYEDKARRYGELESGARVMREPRPYQVEALKAWRERRGRGVVVLPTGAGKTQVALMAIDDRKRDALVIAPTLDLVRQWYDQLKQSFGVAVGIVGGGDHEVRPLTVTTYDSAHLHMEHLGSRFGLLIFDECHHLPGASYALSARLSIAPFRLGLTATPERADGREKELEDLIGPEVYRRNIVELSGDYLSDYETVRLVVELSPQEREEYELERSIYRGFVSGQGIFLGAPSGWKDFLMRASRSTEGRRAMAAYRRQRELALAAPAKLDVLERLLARHCQDRCILFTQDNATAYQISRRFLVPIITHQTKVRERSEILADFASGVYQAVSTSKVLNEGVDVPDANVAVVLSGSASVREHVQRLGRILRKKDGKRAVLYELVSGGTAETYISERRREHVAYR